MKGTASVAALKIGPPAKCVHSEARSVRAWIAGSVTAPHWRVAPQWAQQTTHGCVILNRLHRARTAEAELRERLDQATDASDVRCCRESSMPYCLSSLRGGA